MQGLKCGLIRTFISLLERNSADLFCKCVTEIASKRVGKIKYYISVLKINFTRAGVQLKDSACPACVRSWV
jgi:hypothetical protein